MTVVIDVAVELPRHGDLTDVLSYESDVPLAPGTLVRVPLGKRVVRGIVWPRPVARDAAQPPGAEPVALRRPVGVAADLPPLSPAWRDLVGFAAGYYQRSVGELAIASLPPQLRLLDEAQLGRVLAKQRAKAPGRAAGGAQGASPPLTEAQAAALDAITARTAGTTLLWGVTGSGKTEVYLRAAQAALDAGRQVLVLVPEINLTPQLEARFAQRFGTWRMASLHSGLTPARRLANWLAAHLGQAQLVLGTRLAIFASMPHLGLVVVDEEHDPSYKQQEGARYSARDLAVWRGQRERIPVLLGSATPSLETWQHATRPPVPQAQAAVTTHAANGIPATTTDGGQKARPDPTANRYARVDLRERIGAAALPEIRLVDMRALPREVLQASPLAPTVLDAMRHALARGEQSMVLLNRRGYAPALHCPSCAWKSACPHCSAWRVFHKPDRSLRCHHCGFFTRVPRACPECGDLDIAAVGRGTQKLEEQLGEALPGARILRIDADSVRRTGALEEQLAAVHAGEVDVLVGTQMVAKGHDFRRMTLVVAVNPDGALFTSDFRAPERLFALLMQAAGRSGRDAAQGSSACMWVQTWHPQHPLYAALRMHDYEGFAATQLDERRRAGLPPFASLALLRADAKQVAHAQAFLQAASDAARDLPEAARVNLYPPVPLPVARVADVERMQMLVESRSRAALQRMLSAWNPRLHEVKARHKGVLRYAVDVDPLGI